MDSKLKDYIVFCGQERMDIVAASEAEALTVAKEYFNDFLELKEQNNFFILDPREAVN